VLGQHADQGTPGGDCRQRRVPLLTLQGPASTIVNMDSSGDPPHTAQVLRDELGVTGAEREELTKARVADDKHPEAGQ
jgi:hypothetical protein